MKIDINTTEIGLQHFAKALEILAPGALWSIEDDHIYWEDSNSVSYPGLDRIIIIAEQEKAKWIYNTYSRLRKAEYDKLNQFELMYNDKINGTNTWESTIVNIKRKYPKPS